MPLFSDLIKQLRRAHRKTLQEVADALELSVSLISDVEQGRRKPFENDKIFKLALLFKVEPTEMLNAAARDRNSIELPIDKGETFNALAFSLMRANSENLESEETKRLMQELINSLQEGDKKHE